MSLGLARVRPREAARVQVPWATSLAMNFALRARRFAADVAIANWRHAKSTRTPVARDPEFSPAWLAPVITKEVY